MGGMVNSMCMHVYAQSLSLFWLFGTLQTVACQAPLSTEFSRQEYWRGLPLSFSRGSSRPRDQTCISRVPCTGRQILYHWATRRALLRAAWVSPFSFLSCRVPNCETCNGNRIYSELENPDIPRVWRQLGLLCDPRPTPNLSTCQAPLNSDCCESGPAQGGQAQGPTPLASAGGKLELTVGASCWERTESWDTGREGELLHRRDPAQH